MIGILGGGLSGFTLAHQLEIGGYKDFIIIDNFKGNLSSNVAAGLFNPLVFKNLNLGWLGAEMYNSVQNFYPLLEQKLGSRFYFRKPLYRIFANVEMQNNWEIATKNLNLSSFVEKGISSLEKPVYKNSFGAGKINTAGYVDVYKYLNLSREYFFKTNRFIDAQIDFKAITLKESHFNLNLTNNALFKFDKLVSCLGVQEASSPLFGFLPFALVKGEGITIKSDYLNENYIVNKQCFVLPIGNKLFKVGSTYNWNDIDAFKSEAAKIEMINKVKEITDTPFDLVETWAGIRPATRDRRPFLGEHPNIKNLFVFGGMGSKAVLLSPYLAEITVNAVLNGAEVPLEMSILRCKKHWKPISGY